ncbi:16S rRNA (adenine(1518)-N(6)/adenine(1519)-N(6))-dimethyltransferase RsmA [Rhodopirellula sallentina]|uniref:Ribosomal RNA small subunit methyltransferase A n=1 Tax=Rhodopirellula sallentina SM41 TaxID=1263870 RepID=M5U019_9BACT|nr:16S rRNA (adenine(1518)-N(6)/adenine(1519)-N(6))-dimethyltransferase RsmA [Rhodopirellula sallentina]EMI54790.1 dimethyladenosine transferase [Rhodopirellula sallentina SM41]
MPDSETPNPSDTNPEDSGDDQIDEVVKLDRDRSKYRRPASETPAPVDVSPDVGGNAWNRKPKKTQPKPAPVPEDQSQAAYIRAKRAQQGSRQTVSYLSKRLTSAGLRPVSKYGQNFLVDLNLIELIARSAELTQNDVVLEIGTGVGSLTGIMAEQAGAILTVEIDKNLYQLAGEELRDYPHVKMIQGDALRNKNSLRSDIMESIRDARARLPEEGRFMLVANLPYNVATPIVSNLLHETPPPDRIVVTIQKELAERMIAGPGSKDYGALSVWVQSVCKAEIVRVLSPNVFWPRPKVESAIIRLDVDHERRNAIPDLQFFHQTVRALFFHRRKFLRSVVISAFKGRLDKSVVDDVLATLGYDEKARAEQLALTQIGELVEALRQAEIKAAG